MHEISSVPSMYYEDEDEGLMVLCGRIVVSMSPTDHEDSLFLDIRIKIVKQSKRFCNNYLSIFYSGLTLVAPEICSSPKSNASYIFLGDRCYPVATVTSSLIPSCLSRDGCLISGLIPGLPKVVCYECKRVSVHSILFAFRAKMFDE